MKQKMIQLSDDVLHSGCELKQRREDNSKQQISPFCSSLVSDFLDDS